MINGTLVGVNSTLTIGFDLWNIAKDVKNIAKYIKISFNFKVNLFKFGFYMFFEAMDCDFFTKYGSFLSKKFI